MTPFKRAYFAPDQVAAMAARLRRNGIAEAVIERLEAERRAAVVWRNDAYQVDVSSVPGTDAWPEMICLSIKTIDKRAHHDWRELQAIKNEILGKEYEAVELYPADARLMDTANQFFLWALADPSMRFPFGFTQRAVATPEQAAAFGATQRAGAQ